MTLTRTPRPVRTFSRSGLEPLEPRRLMAFFIVNSTADLSSPPAGMITLRSAIQASNASATVNTIVIPTAGTYKLTGGIGISDDNSLTIENTSKGTVTIEGNGLSDVFLIDPATFNEAVTDTFVGLTITDGNAGGLGDGGGILTEDATSLILNQCVVTGNIASDGGGVALDGTGTLTLNGTQVVGNHASNVGGGIVSIESGVVNIGGQSLIAGNTAGGIQGGGGIDMFEGKLTVTGSTIRDNRALVGVGGGIAATGGPVAISGSIVEGNFSAQSGGGYYANSAGGATITDSFFLGNAAVGNGGGLSGVKGLIQIRNTTFGNNAAQAGGGADFSAAGDPAITDSSFVGNLAEAAGGGISDEGVAELSLFNCTVQGNRSLLNGGGLAAATTGDVSISSSLFLGDIAAAAGGALSMSNGSLEAFSSRFSDNAAASGGALNIAPSSFTINDDTLDNNRAAGDGGAMLLDLVSNNNGLTNDTITADTAAEGGGLDLDAGSGSVALVDDTIDGNSASSGGDGGGVYQDFNLTVNAKGTIFAGNTAAGSPNDYEYVNGTLNDKGGNLLGNATGDGSKFGPSTVFGDPKLGPLVDNGGNLAGAPVTSQVVPTQALLPGSPAIGTGPTGISNDERGFNRPAAHPSIGAYEPQYAANATANQVFVENLYEVLLNRVADPGGLAGGTAFLNGGGTPTALAQALEGSGEYLKVEADQLVRRYLDRAPTATELTNVTAFLAGHTPEQAAAIFINSPEFAADYGNSQDAFVEALYQTSLGRAAEPAEVVSWDTTLAAGLSRPAMVNLFLTSDGYLSDLIAADFEAYLGRAPRPSEAAACLAAMHSGFSDASLAALILGTTESFGGRT